MSEYKPYPDYKDSGVEWLGCVPSHWEVKAIRWLSPVQRGASPRPIDDEKYFDDEEGAYGWVRIEDVSASNGFLGQTKQRLSALGAELSVKLEPGALFLSIAGSVGKPCINLVKVCIHDGFVYFPLLSINPMWLFKIFESRIPFVGLGKMGTQLNLNTETVGGIRIAIPPEDEIEAILTWVDLNASRIDGLISKKTRFIELLREKRQAMITRAVTKGLDASALMKESGVVWLGNVPAHWAVTPLKYLTDIGNGSTPSRENHAYWSEGEYPWLNSSVVNQENVTDATEFVTWRALRECHLPKIVPPAVLVGITGQGRTRGMATTLLFEATINQHMAFVKPKTQSIVVEYLRRVFDVAYQYLRDDSDGGGSTKGALTCEQISCLSVPVPDSKTQREIASFVDRSAAKIDSVISKTERSIALLSERRSALITAAVTGQIDLREAA